MRRRPRRHCSVASLTAAYSCPTQAEAVQQGDGAAVPHVGAARTIDGILGSASRERVASQVGPQLIAEPLYSRPQRFGVQTSRLGSLCSHSRRWSPATRFASVRARTGPTLVRRSGLLFKLALRSIGLGAWPLGLRSPGGARFRGARAASIRCSTFGHGARTRWRRPSLRVGRRRSQSVGWESASSTRFARVTWCGAASFNLCTTSGCT